jgi:sugar lactone lactonase YvrE
MASTKLLKLTPLVFLGAWVSARGSAQAAGPVCVPSHLVNVTVGPGPEDLAWDVKRSRLLISSALRSDKRKCEGQIQAMPIPLVGLGVSPKPLVSSLALDRSVAGKPFCPIGMSLIDEGEDTYLYVIVTGLNHGDPKAIEKFRVEEERLVLLDRFEDKLLLEPNDVVAAPGDELYVSNASGHRGLARLFEQLFKKRWAKIAHYRRGKWTVGVAGIGFPNGLALEAGGTRLRVAAFNERRVLTFVRDAEGRLTRAKETVELDAYPDNLMQDGDDLLVAGHPNRSKTLAHILNPLKAAPSIVYRVNPKGERQVIFEDDGARISGSSTAFIHEAVLYVSQVRRGSLAVCPLTTVGH